MDRDIKNRTFSKFFAAPRREGRALAFVREPGAAKIMRRVALLSIVLLLSSCYKEPQPQPLPPDNDPKLFVMYDNIMDWFKDDVAEAEAAVAAGALAQGQRVLVFQRPRGRLGQSPFYPDAVIYEIVQNSNVSGRYERRMLHRYNGDMTPTAENMRRVLTDIVAAAPEANHLGLAYGSHGMGWVPKISAGAVPRKIGETDGGFTHYLPPELQPHAELWAPPSENDRTRRGETRFFQSDLRENFDVSEFVQAMSGWKWDFVLLDDCFMSSVEALYDMRTVADYIISSPTEIMSRGFDYGRVINTVFRNWGENGFAAVASGFVDYYLTVPSPRGGLEPYATVSVVKTAELQGLANAVRAIAHDPAGYNTVDPVARAIQSYDGLNIHVFWDLDHYMRYFSRSVPLYDAFVAQLGRTVVFTRHTPQFYSAQTNGGAKPITHFSGLDVFIPYPATSGLNAIYQQTAWYSAVFQ